MVRPFLLWGQVTRYYMVIIHILFLVVMVEFSIYPLLQGPKVFCTASIVSSVPYSSHQYFQSCQTRGVIFESDLTP